MKGRLFFLKLKLRDFVIWKEFVLKGLIWLIFLKRSLSVKINWLFYECIIDFVYDVDK